MRRLLILLAILVSLACSLPGQNLPANESLRVKTFGSASCKGKSKPTKAEEATALAALKRSLLLEFINESPEPRRSLLNAKSDELLASMDLFLPQLTILDSQFDKATRTYTLVGEADVDPGRFDKLIDQPVKSANQNAVRSYISWIFVARRQATVKEIGPKVATGSSKLKSEEVAASASQQPGFSSVSTISKSEDAIVTESAVTKTADEVVYLLEDNKKASIDAVMSKVFVDRGFDVVPASELVRLSNNTFNPDKLQADFKTSSQFSLENQQTATRLCREAGLPFLAFGALTIGVKEGDPATGMTRVSVIIDAQVLDCRNQFVIKAGSIGALQVSALGPNQTEAETLAIQKASEQAATIIADQLRQRLNR
jgi:hypothetical protein